MSFGVSRLVQEDMPKMSDLAKLLGGDTEKFMNALVILREEVVGGVVQLPDVGEACDNGDVAQLNAQLERRVRVGELEDAVPPLGRGCAPLVGKGGSRTDVEAEVSRFSLRSRNCATGGGCR